MTQVAIINAGKIISGDLKKGILDADTILVRDGKIAKVGRKKDIDLRGVERRIDANGMVVIPGLIDTHTHLCLGDYSSINKALDWMEGALYAGVTSIISQGENATLGYPNDALGVKSIVIAAKKIFKNFKPGGYQKVHAGAIILVKGLTERDFEEMADEGVRLVAEIGGTGLYKPTDVKEMVGWAKKYGMKVNMHCGGRSIPGSAAVTAEMIMEVDPDIVAHVNGGSTAPSYRTVEKLVRETGFVLEVIHNGNPKMLFEIMRLMEERNELNRVIIGSDTPTGMGAIICAMLRTIVQISSLNGIPAHEVIALATGNSADVYGLNRGKIERGREADILIIDRPPGSLGRDALEAIGIGDTPGTAMVMVDGKIVALRGRDTRVTCRNIKINGVEQKVTNLGEFLAGPRHPGY